MANGEKRIILIHFILQILQKFVHENFSYTIVPLKNSKFELILRIF
jgi:hypothetical protein